MPSCTASCSPCVQGPTGSRPPSLICRDGWRTSNSRVPNPWVALAARPHLNLLRAPPGIVWKGLRRYLSAMSRPEIGERVTTRLPPELLERARPVVYAARGRSWRC